MSSHNSSLLLKVQERTLVILARPENLLFLGSEHPKIPGLSFS
jgi:hypothetical protein